MSLKTDSFEFGDFCLETNERILLRHGKPVPLTPKTLQLLFLLVENHGKVVEKEALIEAIWADSFVEEGNLTFTVSLLRKALNDNKQTSRFIETVPKRGYRFVAEVKRISTTNDLVEKNSTEVFLDKQSKLRSYAIYLSVGFVFLGLIAFGFWFFKNEAMASNVPILSEPFSLEKLSTDGKVFNAIISPDGKKVVYTSGGYDEDKSIWLRQLETGDNIEIIPPGKFNYHGFAFSPDGIFVYFHRRLFKRNEASDIYRVSIFGGIPQRIVNNSYGKVNLSPDGKQITFFRYNSDLSHFSLLTANASDGKNEQEITIRQNPFRISDAIFSPDGKSIIFASGQSRNAANEFGLYEIDLESKIESEFISEKFFNINKLAWLPDNAGILITASKIPSKYFRLWLVSNKKNDATALTKDSESYSSISMDNAAEMIVSTQVKPSFQAEIFHIDSPSVSIQPSANAVNVTFAPNGKLIYSSATSGNDEIWSIQPTGIERKQLTNNPADESSPIVSPDNNSIYFSSNRTGQVQVWRMNFDGTNQIQITNKEGGFPLFTSPDGKWIYYKHGLKRTLWRASTQNNQEFEQQVLSQESDYFAISPNGELIAFVENKDLESNIIISKLEEDNQVVKSIPSTIPECFVTDLKWMPDNKSLIYLLKDPQNQSNTLWQYFLNEEKHKKIADLGSQSIPHLTISPDGKTFAIIRGNWQHNAVLLKGLK